MSGHHLGGKAPFLTQINFFYNNPLHKSIKLFEGFGFLTKYDQGILSQ